jgi:hypothetical protein
VKTKIWITVAFLVTFVLGFTAGYLVPREPLPTPRNQWAQDRSEDRSENREREMRDRSHLAQELNLSADQRDVVEQLTLEFSQKVRRTLQDANVATRDRISVQHDSLSLKMREVLNDEQFEKWEKHHQRRMEMLQRRGR